jgi:hypothetical protein
MQFTRESDKKWKIKKQPVNNFHKFYRKCEILK